MPAYKITHIVVYLDGAPLHPGEVPVVIAKEITKIVREGATETQITSNRGVYTWKTFIEEGLAIHA